MSNHCGFTVKVCGMLFYAHAQAFPFRTDLHGTSMVHIVARTIVKVRALCQGKLANSKVSSVQ